MQKASFLLLALVGLAQPILGDGDFQCTLQAEGQCYMLSTFNFDTDKGHNYHELHDNNCKQIGQAADIPIPYSFDSQLPNPINFKDLGMPKGETPGHLHFEHGGQAQQVVDTPIPGFDGAGDPDMVARMDPKCSCFNQGQHKCTATT
ncbi:hypothetical protein MMC10_005473 [Thelotrema lepadinum]|nr:hypothetical protein [Thelotrema lepadinum]